MRYINYIYILLLLSKSQAQVSIQRLMNDVEILSSPEMEGRMAGSEAYDKAAQYCVSVFQENGVKSLQHSSLDGYRQNFNIQSNTVNKCELKITNSQGKFYKLKLGSDYVCRGFTGSGSGTADVVFCGYGQAKDSYNDYRGMDLKGKAVMIFKANPPFTLEDEIWDNFSIRRQVETAKQHGAAAVIFVSRHNEKFQSKPIGSLMHGEGKHNAEIPQFQIDISWADSLLEGTRYPLERLDNLIEDLRMPFSVFTQSKIEYDVQAHYNPQTPTYNIMGVIEGSDPELKSEYIIVGAHLDHVGKIGDLVYPGANDNASGSAAVLELARLISQNRDKLKRSVIFTLFTAEEQGLEGSKFMAQNLPVPKEKIAFVLNLDCIAHGDSIRVGNGKSYPHLWEKVKEIDITKSGKVVDATWGGGGADLTPFHNLEIPGLYFASQFSYTHLHLPTDTPETLNKELYKDMVELIYHAILELE